MQVSVHLFEKDYNPKAAFENIMHLIRLQFIISVLFQVKNIYNRQIHDLIKNLQDVSG